MKYDFNQIVNRIRALENSPKFISNTSEGGFVVGDRVKNIFYKIFILIKDIDNNEQSVFINMIPDIQFGLSFDEIIPDDNYTYFQIYGELVNNKFIIDEFCKKTQDMRIFNSVLFLGADTPNLAEYESDLKEFIGIIDRIENL
jgi:hypothetical protein